MYIDKIYTKLYSDKNWNGLRQLVTEIKLFARKDYEGLTKDEVNELREERDKVAREMRRRRINANVPVTKAEVSWATNKMHMPTDTVEGQVVDQINDMFYSPMAMKIRRKAARDEYKNNLGKSLDEITDMSNKLRSDAVAKHNDKIHDKYTKDQYTSNPLPELNLWQKLRQRIDPSYEPESRVKVTRDNQKAIEEKFANDPNTIMNEPSKRYRDKPDYMSWNW